MLNFEKALRENYVFDQSINLWHRQDGVVFQYSDGDEVEDRIAAIMQSSFDRSTMSIELQQSITDWPSNYHFSSRRANLMRPIRDLLKGTILEIGAGTGAITRFLGENGGRVVAVEGSARRAAAAATRCVDLSNVTVVADDFAAFPSGPKFDVVTLIGVLEYARIFFRVDDGDPVSALIARARSFLRPGGILIVAIENQLGLKYLAGCPEDHLGEPMVGVEDLYRDDTVVTFGRAELSRRLADAGGVHQQWWFPSPDYKLPVSLLSEEVLRHEVDLSALLSEAVRADPQISGPLAFSLERAWRPAFRNGLLADLANSFLVLSSDTALPAHNILGVHYGAARRPEFAKEVRFEWHNDSVVVRRSHLYPEAGPAREEVISLRLSDESFLPTPSWHSKLAELTAREGWGLEEWSAWARGWLDAVLSVVSLDADGLTHRAIIPGEFVDAIPRNLSFDHTETPHFFDQEWKLNEPLEIGFLVYRGIFDSLETLMNCAKPVAGVSLNRLALFQHFTRSLGWKVSPDDIRRYAHLEVRIWKAASGGGERLLSSHHALIPVRAGLRDLQLNSLQAAQQTLVETQAALEASKTTITQLQSELCLRDSQLAAQVQRAVEVENQLADQARRVIEAENQLNAFTRSPTWRVALQMRRAVPTPLVDVARRIKRKLCHGTSAR